MQGLTPLMVASLREEVSLVKLLLETGASLDSRNPGIGIINRDMVAHG